MNPIARIRLGTRAALRRRYGYAALRVLRRALRTASADHRTRQLAPAPYSIKTNDVRNAYAYALQRLRRRWPALNPSDPRAKP